MLNIYVQETVMYLNSNLNIVFYAVIAVIYVKEYLEVLTKISLLVCYMLQTTTTQLFLPRSLSGYQILSAMRS